MKQILAAALVAAFALPAAAQQEPAPEDRGRDLFEEGARNLLRGLLNEIEPRMRDFAEEVEPRLRDLADGMAPLMEDLAGLMDDLTRYEAPEMLPNGDIIIRRKPPELPTLPDEATPDSGPIDL